MKFLTLADNAAPLGSHHVTAVIGRLAQPANWRRDDYFDPDLLLDGRLVHREGYCTDIFTDDAMAFIEQHQREPWFCYLATNAPHSPFSA